jgi:hypothetical protein
VNDDGASLDGRSGNCTITSTKLVIVNHVFGGEVPDLDAEFIHTATAEDLAVNGSQHETVASNSVYGANTLILCLCTSNYKPIISCAAEV